MAEFCKLYNVDYFKIDGFAWKPCRERGHNHPPAKGDFKAFYTFLWEEWIKGFEKIREANPDVCLNVTSFSHCSPWFLMYADYIWMNNASDMDFAGKGSDMQQCLNYRDGRYRDLFVRKKYRFPAAHLYNHEPTYAARNYRTRADKLKNKPIIYTDEEFSLYVRCCLMRGSGLAELYFSPEMMTPAKWEAAARELGFAERYSYLLSRSEFFGGSPERGEVYGYIAAKGDEYLKIRELDCLVINSINEFRKAKKEPLIDVIRAPFLEGEPLYAGASFMNETHIQICVKDPAAIRGYFIPPQYKDMFKNVKIPNWDKVLGEY